MDKTTDLPKKNQKNIYKIVAGNTLGSHEKFLRKLIKRGAKEVESPKDSDAIIIFCPIVSRFESDIESALWDISDCENVILVAMHHTLNKDYTLIKQRGQINPKVRLLVDCLFHEKKGLLSCSCNKKAVKMVHKELGLGKKKRLQPPTFP